MEKRDFDYYIFIDYSANLIGYNIIEKEKIKELLPKISKLHHYKKIKHKKEYISAVKKRFEKENIEDYLLKLKIKKIRLNLEIFIDVIKFIKKNDNCAIFISVDNHQYNSFIKLIKIVQHQKDLVIIRESELNKNSVEYRLSLIIDNLLNIKRRMSK